MHTRLNQQRSDIPAVTHLDYSARLQTVNPADKPDYYAIISEFEKLTGCAVVVNTSFNVRGEPIVCTPQEAYQCFMRTQMDVLVMKKQSIIFEFWEFVKFRKRYWLIPILVILGLLGRCPGLLGFIQF